jgi:peptidyl-prolyl cis-trans isomerase D
MSDKYNSEEESVLQKIQNKTGCLMLVIGVAMLAFVLTDLVGSGSSIFGSSANSVGSIDGVDISYDDFNAEFEETKAQIMRNNPGVAMDEAMNQQYRDETWDKMVDAKTLLPEYQKLGVTVSPAELEDLTIGNNTHPQIRQSFTDPQSGQFDKNRLIRFLKEDINSNPEALASWNTFQKQFTSGLVAQKYGSLISSTFYATDLEARTKGKDEKLTINASIVAMPYEQIADSLYKVEDSDILSFAKRFGKKYEQDANRDIEYVKLMVVPSKEDSTKMLNWASDAIEKFSTAKDDSAFVSIMSSETPFNPAFQVRGSFPPALEDKIFDAPTGTVTGPFENNGTYTLIKVVSTGTDSLRSVKASHILFSVFGNDTAKAEEEAREALSKIRSGASTFEQEASLKNYDATRGTGGDMGWVREESTVYPKRLMNALFNSGQGNYIVVRSESGVHLAKATSAVSKKTVKVAILDQTIYPSTATDGEYYRIAGELLTKVNAKKSFEEVSEALGLTKRVANKISEKNRTIAGLENSSKVTRWLFDENTKEGDMSSIIDLSGSYVVALVSKVREQGLPEATELRGELENMVRNELKAKDLLPKMEEALAKSKTIDGLAKAMNTTVMSAPAASFNSGSLPFIGQDEKIIGTILGTPVGKFSKAIEGKAAVAVVYVNNENQYEATDLKSLKMQLKMESAQSAQGEVKMALEKKADVKDTRYKFYD